MWDLSLQCEDSLVGACGLGWPVAFEILGHWLGIKPASHALQGETNHWTTEQPEKSLTTCIIKHCLQKIEIKLPSLPPHFGDYLAAVISNKYRSYLIFGQLFQIWTVFYYAIFAGNYFFLIYHAWGLVCRLENFMYVATALFISH